MHNCYCLPAPLKPSAQRQFINQIIVIIIIFTSSKSKGRIFNEIQPMELLSSITPHKQNPCTVHFNTNNYFQLVFTLLPLFLSSIIAYNLPNNTL